MQTWEAITSRRNVRSFADRPVPASDLDQILEAGRRSPSSQNWQPWDFILVTQASPDNPWGVAELLQALREAGASGAVRRHCAPEVLAAQCLPRLSSPTRCLSSIYRDRTCACRAALPN